jgi:hypothetical protein
MSSKSSHTKNTLRRSTKCCVNKALWQRVYVAKIRKVSSIENDPLERDRRNSSSSSTSKNFTYDSPNSHSILRKLFYISRYTAAIRSFLMAGVRRVHGVPHSQLPYVLQFISHGNAAPVVGTLQRLNNVGKPARAPTPALQAPTVKSTSKHSPYVYFIIIRLQLVLLFTVCVLTVPNNAFIAWQNSVAKKFYPIWRRRVSWKLKVLGHVLHSSRSTL